MVLARLIVARTVLGSASLAYSWYTRVLAPYTTMLAPKKSTLVTRSGLSSMTDTIPTADHRNVETSPATRSTTRLQCSLDCSCERKKCE